MEICRAVAQLGRAPRSGRGGREFKSRRPDHFREERGEFLFDKRSQCQAKLQIVDVADFKSVSFSEYSNGCC